MTMRPAYWVMLGWTIFAALWIVGVIVVPPDCTAYTSRALCDAANRTNVTATVIAFLIAWLLGLGMIGLFIAFRRSPTRICPACGTPAKMGNFICQRCGYNFATAAGIPSPGQKAETDQR